MLHFHTKPTYSRLNVKLFDVSSCHLFCNLFMATTQYNIKAIRHHFGVDWVTSESLCESVDRVMKTKRLSKRVIGELDPSSDRSHRPLQTDRSPAVRVEDGGSDLMTNMLLYFKNDRLVAMWSESGNAVCSYHYAALCVSSVLSA